MSVNTNLAKYIPTLQALQDLSLTISGKLLSYDDTTVYHYSVVETEYRDKTKTLLNTYTNVHMYFDFPGDVPFLNAKFSSSIDPSNIFFIEDLLPIIAIFPWKHNGSELKVDIFDELDIKLFDDVGKTHTLKFEIKERKSDFQQQYLNRSFVVVPVRLDDKDYTVKGTTPKDQNIEVGKITYPIYSEYE